MTRQRAAYLLTLCAPLGMEPFDFSHLLNLLLWLYNLIPSPLISFASEVITTFVFTLLLLLFMLALLTCLWLYLRAASCICECSARVIEQILLIDSPRWPFRQAPPTTEPRIQNVVCVTLLTKRE